jgi:crossover junction endodeoxyribonuclease RusA
MTVEFTFSVAGDPRPQGSMSVYGGRIVHVKAAKLNAWRDMVAQSAREAMPADWPLTDGPVAVALTFALRRPKGHYARSGAILPWAPTVHAKRPDIDKLARAVLDALTVAAVWQDDSRVADLMVRKTWGTVPRLTCTCQAL